jgi:hypothetical protein
VNWKSKEGLDVWILHSCGNFSQPLDLEKSLYSFRQSFKLWDNEILPLDDLALGDTLSNIGQQEGNLGVAQSGGVESLDAVGAIDGVLADSLGAESRSLKQRDCKFSEDIESWFENLLGTPTRLIRKPMLLVVSLGIPNRSTSETLPWC